MLSKIWRIVLIILFFLNSILPADNLWAQAVTLAPTLPSTADTSQLISLSKQYSPAIVRGLSIYPDDPLKFDFIINTGDGNLSGEKFKKESQKLIKYFLAALTVPEKELWVNLSPYEKNHMIPEGLGGTQMGVDMLAQDYLLKKITASMMYPENDLGKKFWSRVYEKAYEKFGTTQIPVNAFNKVWITPDKAVVYEKNNSVFIAERHLKVLLEEDYLALGKNTESNQIGSQIVRQIILPEIEKEVNSGENFAQLRQIYNSLILASWYKKKLHDSLLGKAYVNSNKTRGVDADDQSEKEKVYGRYIETFKKGVFNFIKEERDPISQQTIPRKYFSGGLTVGAAAVKDLVVLTGDLAQLSSNMESFVVHPESTVGKDQKVTWHAVDVMGNPDGAMTSTILDAHEFPFQPINPVADFPAREFPDIKIADRKSTLPLFIDISDDLQTLSYYEVLDDSKVFSADGSVHYDVLNEGNGTVRKIATFPSSYLVSPRKWMLEHFKKGTPEQEIIEKIWPQGKRYTRYRGVTTSWDMKVDKDVWSTNIDTVFLHEKLFESGVLSLPQNRVKKLTEIGVGGGHISSLLSKTFPQAQLSITDISSYALSTTLLNISANHPQGQEALSHVKKYWGKGIANLEDNQDLIIINPPYIPAAPFEKGPANDPYRGTGLIREIIKDGYKKLNPDNPEASIYINISSMADKDVKQYLEEFGDTIELEPVGSPLKVPLKIRWMSEAWKQWLANENGGLEHIDNPVADQEEYWHSLQLYRIRRKAETPKPKRIAIIGGTFDPLHIAHRKMIEDVKAELNVDEVIVVPTNVSPHKQGLYSAPKNIRYEMAKVAVAGLSGVKVSDFDVNRDGPSFTIDLVDHIRSQYVEGSKFFFVIGDDNIEKLDTWRNIDELTKKVNFVAYTRPGKRSGNSRINIQRIERPGIDISATLIRERVALGLPLTGFVSAAVERIIQESNLYLPEDIFSPNGHDPIYSLNGQAFKDDKPFVLVIDVHGTLLATTWKKEYALAFQHLTQKSFEEGLRWVENQIVQQMLETTRDVPIEEIISMMSRELALNNITKSREEIRQEFLNSRQFYESPKEAKAMPGAIEAIKELRSRGVPIQIISGSRSSQIVYEQLQNAGYGELITQEDVFDKDRQDQTPTMENYSARESTIKHIIEGFPGHRLVLLDDWMQGANITKRLDGIFVALPQGEGLEQKRNSNRLRAEGAALEIINPRGWERLVSLLKVLDERRKDQLKTMVEKKVRVSMAQFNPTVGDLVGNFDKISAILEEEKDKQSEIVVFPELSMTGYLPGDLLRNKEFVTQNKQMLRLLAKKAKGITAIVGFVDINQWGQIFNALAVISNGEVQGIYHKKALPNYGVFMEKRYFTSGEKGLFDFEGNSLNKHVFNINGLIFAINDCEDIWIEKDGHKQTDGSVIQEPVDHWIDAPYDEQVAMGAKLIINASASPYRQGVLKTRDELLAKRAKELGTTIVYLNIVGGQDEVVFDGNSLVVAPDGKVLARGKAFEEDTLRMDLTIKTPQHSDAKLAETIKIANAPADSSKEELANTPEVKIPSEIELKFKGLVMGLRDYMRKNGIKKVIFGNSGGIDSGVVGALAAIALGPENVYSMSLPTRFNSEGTKSDARLLAEKLGIGFEETSIEDVFRTTVASLLPQAISPLPQATQTAIENIQARLRMIYLMFRSNERGYLLLSTSNKSESAVGYTTIYGDMSGGFALIKDLYKTDVFEMARFINQYWGKEVIPESMITRPPSAELREGQKDEDSLPKYTTELDPILQGLIEESLSPQEVSQKTGLPLEMVIRIRKMVDVTEWKRRQAPIGVKLTSVAFGHHERRMPITNRYDSQTVQKFISGQKSTGNGDEAQLTEILSDNTIFPWEGTIDDYLAYLDKYAKYHNYPLRNLDNPPVYTSQGVIKAAQSATNPTGYAHPNLDDPSLPSEQREMLEEQIKADVLRWSPGTSFVDNRPRNDLRTGMKGRGKLGNYGPNQAEDPVLLRFNEKGELEVLLVDRADDTGKGFPGGFSNRGQENKTGFTATREAIEETLSESEYAVDFRAGEVFYEGKTFSGRDTDDAWIVTRASAVLLSYEASQKLLIKAGDDAREAKWFRVEKDLLKNMVDAHSLILKSAVKALVSGQIQIRDDLIKPQKSLLKEASSRENDPAMVKGGIDFNTSMLNLQVKSDNKNAILLSNQNSFPIKIEGLFPVIISVSPINVEQLILFNNSS